MNSTEENFKEVARELKTYPTNRDWVPSSHTFTVPQGTHRSYHQCYVESRLPHSGLLRSWAVPQASPHSAASCAHYPQLQGSGMFCGQLPEASWLTANCQSPIASSSPSLPSLQNLPSPPGHTGQEAVFQQKPPCKTPASDAAPQESPTHLKQWAAMICEQSNCPLYEPGGLRQGLTQWEGVVLHRNSGVIENSPIFFCFRQSSSAQCAASCSVWDTANNTALM